jgi:hypothetical protein
VLSFDCLEEPTFGRLQLHLQFWKLKSDCTNRHVLLREDLNVLSEVKQSSNT